MLQYNEVLKKVVPGNFSRISGYFGERENCQFAIVNNQLLEVYPFGYFRSAIKPTVQDESELNWLIDNHPNMKKYYKRVKP